MPAYNNPGGGDAAMYEDAPESGESETHEKEEAGDQPTATIPKSLLAGKDFKPGDEIVLEIVSLHENEAVVKYASEKGGKEEAQEAPARPGMGQDAEMAEMMG